MISTGPGLQSICPTCIKIRSETIPLSILLTMFTYIWFSFLSGAYSSTAFPSPVCLDDLMWLKTKHQTVVAIKHFTWTSNNSLFHLGGQKPTAGRHKRDGRSRLTVDSWIPGLPLGGERFLLDYGTHLGLVISDKTNLIVLRHWD